MSILEKVKFKTNTRGLRFRIISSLSVFFLLIFGMLILFNISEEQKNIKQEMERHGKILANNTFQAIRTPMSTGDNEAISRTFSDIKKGMDDIDFFLLNPERNVTYSTMQDAVGKNMDQRIYSPELLSALKQSLIDGSMPEKGFEEKIDKRPFLSMYHPIPNEKSCQECHDEGNKILGVFMSRQSTAPVYQLIEKLTFKNIVLGVLAFLLVAGALSVLISRLVVNPIRKVDDVLKDIAEGEGDLTARLKVNRRDELGELSQYFNIFVEKLHGIVSQVIQSAVTFSEVTEQIAVESGELASRSTQQAASITETSTTMEQFSAAIKDTTTHSQSVNEEVESFNEQIQEKRNLIDNVTATMEAINDSSRKISNIVNVINDISFQTNLLALNAAVEAARAGEAGRGFAVVASEVRILAQKTTEASKNIQEIVSSNVEHTETGMKLVAMTSEFFTSMIGIMQDILNKIGAINTSANEQTHAVEQVNETVADLDKVINQNAELSKELSGNAHRMQLNAQQLGELISQFKI